MSYYMIGVPGYLAPPAPAELERLGIADLIGHGSDWHPLLLVGPSAQPGLMRVVGQRESGDQATSLRWVSGNGVYFGFWPADPPGPTDLARDDARGTPVMLADGQSWLIPNLQESDDRTMRDFVSELRIYFAHDDWSSGFAGQTYVPGSRTILRRALRVNYRLPAELIDNCGLALFDLPTLAECLMIAVGIKSASASTSSVH